MLSAGDSAPKFRTTDILDREVIPFQSGKWTYISFHRFAACPFCVLRTRELIEAYPLFAENHIEMVSIWPSSKANMLLYVGQEKPPFPLVADVRKAIYKQYHVTNSSWMAGLRLLLHPRIIIRALKGKYKKVVVDADPNLLPAEFLVSPAGEIVRAFYGKHFGDHLAISEIIGEVRRRGAG